MTNCLHNQIRVDDYSIDDTGVVTPESPTAIWALSAPTTVDDTAQRTAITDQPFTVGRHSSSSLAIGNSTVSGRHAELLLAGDKLLVRDCDSTNGTLVNGRRIHAVENLIDGDILHFGNAMYVVHRGTMPTGSATECADNASEALGQVQFATLLARPGVQPCYQPIVHLHEGTHIGYEILPPQKKQWVKFGMGRSARLW